MKNLSHFDKLVIHANKECWCFKLGCGTCGNMEFRNGMELIGEGENPLEKVDQLAEMRLMWHDDTEELHDRSLRLAGQVIDANLERYHHDCNGSRWLGYMGLALVRFEDFHPGPQGQDYIQNLHIENRELILKLISNSWSKKFFELFRALEQPGTDREAERCVLRAIEVCKKIMLRERGPFQFEDLETMERALLALRQEEPFN